MANIVVGIRAMPSTIVCIRLMSSSIIQVSVVLQTTVIRIGVDRAGTATIVWVVPIEAWTIFPAVVFGFNLQSVSALLVVVVCIFTYALAMVIVVDYLPSVLRSTTIFTFEHVNSCRATLFIYINAHGVMLRLSGGLLRVLVLPINVRVGGTSGVMIRVIAILRRAIVRTGVERAGTANMSWVVPEAITIFPSVIFGFDLMRMLVLL